jgi:excisionase family DNA binding protein
MTDERWLTLPEAAQATGISLDTWRRWCQQGRVPCTKTFRKNRVKWSEVERIMETGEVSQANRPAKAAKEAKEAV